MPEPRSSAVGIGTLPDGKSLLDLPSHAPRHLLVESSPSASQLAKHAFLAELKQRVIAGAAEELAGTQWSADQCPYLEYWFAYYETRSAEAIEAALHKYVPELARATEASAFFEPAVVRVRRAIARWAGTGELDVPPAAMPAAIAASVQLGLGNPIESATRSRFESAMGTDLSQVRVHSDAPGAQAAAGADARAFAIGNHVAFAAGEYAPGTMRGDALLAHELAHTQQQTATPTGGSSTALHERAADRSATSIWSRLWGSIIGGSKPPAATPAVRTGLQLQRCPQKIDDKPQAFAVDDPPKDVVVVTNPYLEMDEPGRGHAHAVLDQTVEFSLNNKNPTIRDTDSGRLHAKEWAIFPPGATKSTGRWNHVAAKKVKFDRTGRWQIMFEGIHGDVEPFDSGITVDVISLDEAEKQHIAGRDPKKKKQLGYVPFRAGLAKAAIDLAHSGVKEQHLTDRTWIDSDNKNPAAPAFDPIHYTLKPSPGASTFEWYVTMDNWSGMPRDTYYGHQRTIRDGESAFAINSTGPAASFTFADPGVFYVWCDEFDAQHQLVDRIRYIQSVQSAKEYEEGLGKYKSYMVDVDAALEKIEHDKLQQLDTVFVDTYTGRARDLTIFAGPKRNSTKYLVLDLTFGAKRIEFEGNDLAAAVHTFDKKNKYPDGLVKIHASANQTFSVTTNGESDLSKASHTAGHISMIPLAAGLIAAVVPGLEPAAPYLLGLAGAGGAVSGTLSLVDRLQQTHVDVSGAALDVVGIAASLIGSAQAVESIVARRAAAAVGKAATAAHGSRFLLWAQFTTDAVGAVLISAEAIDQIAEINKRTGMNDGQRIDAIVRILTGLALQGGMFVVSAKALAEAQPRLRSALGDAAMGRLAGKTEARALALLDEPAVNALRDVPASDLDRVAELVALDPVTSESALATGKVKSAADLEKAISEGKIGDKPLADVRAPEVKPVEPEAKTPDKTPEPAKPKEPTKPVEPTTKTPPPQTTPPPPKATPFPETTQPTTKIQRPIPPGGTPINAAGRKPPKNMMENPDLYYFEKGKFKRRPEPPPAFRAQAEPPTGVKVTRPIPEGGIPVDSPKLKPPKKILDDRELYYFKNGKFLRRPEPAPPFREHSSRDPRAIPCFPAGTPVALPDGTAPIEALAVGTEVLAFDEVSRATVVRRVTAILRNRAMILIDLTIGTGADAQHLPVTAGHRFWVENRGAFITADRLEAGALLRSDSGRLLPIGNVAVRRIDETPTWNLTVDECHTYFVGALHVLVHNGGESGGKIYIGRNPQGQIVYVGLTTDDLLDRQAAHRQDAINEPAKYGFKRDITLEVVDGMTGLSEDEMRWHERRIYDEIKASGEPLQNPLEETTTYEKLNALYEKYC